MTENILKMENVTKVYPNGVIAVQDANFNTRAGEIHALMGENGAGKSTLMKVLFGTEQPEKGSIYLNGKEVKISSSLEAIQLGIGMVHQHFMLVDHLTAMENIILGMEPKKFGMVDLEEARRQVEAVSKKYKFAIDPDRLVQDMSVSEKQKVEILKVLIRGANILIMDEPTAVLTPQETEELFEQMKELKKTGHTIIFISHKLDEIKAVCDRMTIMRAAKTIGSYNVDDLTTSEISRLMIGRDVVREIEKTPSKPKETVLNVKDLIVINDEEKEVVRGLSLRVRKGEILGIAAIDGNGQRELIDSITGLGVSEAGHIFIKGEETSENNPTQDRRDRGLVHIPEDRSTFGAMMDQSIRDNIIANRFDKDAFNKGISLDRQKIEDEVDQLIEKYQIKTDSPLTPVGMLSGGNIQKVVAARELSVPMSVLIADQPTRGIDVRTAAFIHDTIVNLRDQGAGILLSSADLNEVLELSDSLIVMYDGEITGYFEDSTMLEEEELGLYMLGIKRMEKEVIEREMYD